MTALVAGLRNNVRSEKRTSRQRRSKRTLSFIARLRGVFVVFVARNERASRHGIRERPAGGTLASLSESKTIALHHVGHRSSNAAGGSGDDMGTGGSSMRINWLPFLIVLSANAAGAERTFTCVAGSSPQVGMRASEVRAACGEPDAMVVERVPVRAKQADGSTYVRGYLQLERWSYGRRPTRPAAVLTFELATLKTIEIKPNR